MLVQRHIREVWDAIKPGLLKVKAKAGEAAPWRPEDIYSEVLNNQAALYLDAESADAGFVVVYPHTDTYSGLKSLWIWVAYSPLGDAASRYLNDLKALARLAGCSRLMMSSPRRGFERRTDWQLLSAEFYMEV